MKKGSYWFAFLSEQEQEEFMENAQPSKKFYELMEEKCKDFETFIMNHFTWENTPQGHDYWCEISERNIQ